MDAFNQITGNVVHPFVSSMVLGRLVQTSPFCQVSKYKSLDFFAYSHVKLITFELTYPSPQRKLEDVWNFDGTIEKTGYLSSHFCAHVHILLCTCILPLSTYCLSWYYQHSRISFRFRRIQCWPNIILFYRQIFTIETPLIV